MKKLKLLFVMLIVTMLSIFICNGVNAAETKNLKIIYERPYTGQTYTLRTENITNGYKTFKIVGADGNYDEALYCLRHGLGFGDSTTSLSTNPLEYQYRFNMKTDASNVKNYYRSATNTNLKYAIRDEDYNAILWIIDNMYLPEQDSAEMRAKYLKNAGIVNSELTDDDIEFVQQMALWYYSNLDHNGEVDSFSLPINNWNDAILYNRIMEYDDNEFHNKKLQLDKLYKYLVRTAKENAQYYNSTTYEYEVHKPTIAVTNTNNSETVGNAVVIGPVSMTEVVGNIAYDYEIQVKDKNGTVIPETKFMVVRNKEDITAYRFNDEEKENQGLEHTLKNAVGEGQVYIKVPNRFASNYNLTEISIKPVYTYDDTYSKYKTTATFWTAVLDEQNQQPVIEIEREEIKIFDLALRKYITKVNGSVIPSTKNPAISTGRLDSGDETTADYKHRKNPVVVKSGDLVTYTISVYNEGSIDGVVTEIIDFLPNGLKYVASENSNLESTYTVTYNETDNVIRITPKTGDNLFQIDAYNGELKSDSIEVVCKVTASNKKTSQILTNIATMKYAPADGRNIQDRDSRPFENNDDEFELPRDWPNYKGNKSNPDDLTNSETHYKGQQDDDDFDKVKIEGVNFDLSLRKYITKVNGENIKNSKEPDIDTSELYSDDNHTTSEYKHRKDPVTVKPGDNVTYQISVYNEGNIDGIVTEITDYLPEGLAYNATNNAELEANYNVSYNASTRTISITPKTGTYLFKLNAYDKNKTTAEERLDVKTLEVICTVTAQNEKENQTLTNIATMKYEPANETDKGVTDNDSSPDRFTKPDDFENYKGNDKNPSELEHPDVHYEGQEDDDDFDKIIIMGVQFDLALRKNITKVNGLNITNSKEPNINTSELNSDVNHTTSEYKHRKDPVEVKRNDNVTYKISVYNEGEIDGIVTEIIDFLPEGLIYVAADNTELEANYNVSYDASTRIISITPKTGTYLFKLNAYDKDKTTAEERLDMHELEVVCKVTATTGNTDKVLTNIATMKYAPANAEDADVKDRDSRPYGNNDDNFRLPSEREWPDYDANNNHLLNDSNYYFKGQEDDDDFDKVVIPGVPFDLALRKFITKINGKEITSRIPNVDTSKLNTIDPVTGKKITTATYTHSKEPVVVKQGDIVTYTIRVYNEGELDGYATTIADYIPEGLGYIMDYKTNTDNNWNVVTDSNTQKKMLVGDIYPSEAAVKNLKLSDFYENRVSSLSDVQIYLGKAKITSSAIDHDKIKAYNPELKSTDIDSEDNWQQSINGTDGLYYRDVQVTCIVLAENTFKGQLRNIAEIEDRQPLDEDGNPINNDDIDSPNPVDIDDYTPPEDNSSYQEDDDDYEPLELRYFDLALRKFITAINDDAVTTRIPEPTYNDKGDIEYVHDKTPLYVANSDIVTYTIRVYNEGSVLGYAMEVSDDIPDGLEFLPEHATNKEYRWVMLDKDGKETTDPKVAKEIRTKYLENSLLRPFDPTKDFSTVKPYNPDFAEVKVAFKVVDKNITQPDRIIKNKAQITDDKPVDEDGNELDIPDEDSIPDEWNEGEDDQDVEYIYVKKFDLALLKWVTKTIVTVDGKTTTTETGFTPYDDPEPIAKVVIDKKKLNKTTVKFVYNIIIFNQGEIAGYATEITDYIPAGLEFYEEDNPIWTRDGEGKITTRALEGKLLQPGESATVEVTFRWKNGEKNLGVKTNIAEISEDYNDHGAPDIDSTPDNVKTPDYEKQQEDDDDRALVMLELKTGGFKQSYLWLGFTFLTIIAVGVILIKKYVI